MSGELASLRLCPLASGSKGNAYWVEYGEHRILIDAGLSHRQLSRRAAEVGRDLGELQHLFLTHEHRDHNQALSQILKRHRPVVWGTGGTLRALRGAIPEGTPVRRIDGHVEEAGPLRVQALRIEHDAAEPVAYRVDSPAGSLAVVTDLGQWRPGLVARLRGVGLLVCEANHDPIMLREGPYPIYLKRRVASALGHLSNEAGASLAVHLAREGVANVLLAHLSEKNNSPGLAHDVFAAALEGVDTRVSIDVASQVHPGPWFTVDATAVPSTTR